MSALPPKKEQILRVELAPKQRDMYRAILLSKFEVLTAGAKPPRVCDSYACTCAPGGGEGGGGGEEGSIWQAAWCPSGAVWHVRRLQPEGTGFQQICVQPTMGPFHVPSVPNVPKWRLLSKSGFNCTAGALHEAALHEAALFSDTAPCLPILCMVSAYARAQPETKGNCTGASQFHLLHA